MSEVFENVYNKLGRHALCDGHDEGCKNNACTKKEREREREKNTAEPKRGSYKGREERERQANAFLIAAKKE